MFEEASSDLDAMIAKVDRFLRLSIHDLLTIYQAGNYVNLVEDFIPPHTFSDQNRLPVWVCWWQGFDKAPELVQVCRESRYRCLPEQLFEIHEITFDNLSDYFTFPDWITARFEAGDISYANLSDILRMGLFYSYGGLWLDATYYLAAPISSELLHRPDSFFTIHSREMTWEGDISKGLWTTNLLKLPAGNLLAQFVLNGFYYYFLTNRQPVHYYMIDFLIRIAYLEFPLVREMMDAVPFAEPEALSLQPLLNQPFHQDTYSRLKAETSFFKLTYKDALQRETSSGAETFFGHLIREAKGEPPL